MSTLSSHSLPRGYVSLSKSLNNFNLVWRRRFPPSRIPPEGFTRHSRIWVSVKSDRRDEIPTPFIINNALVYIGLHDDSIIIVSIAGPALSLQRGEVIGGIGGSIYSQNLPVCSIICGRVECSRRRALFHRSKGSCWRFQELHCWVIVKGCWGWYKD